MSDTFDKIRDGIQEIFPEAADMEITNDTTLEEIPDWDSMSAVNLQGYIEQTFQVIIPQDLLVDETTIQEVISYVKDPEKIKEAM